MTSAHQSLDTRIFYKECCSLAAAGHDVTLVAPGESMEHSGVHIVGVGEIPSSRLQRMRTAAKAVYEKARALDADLYHFHDPELLPYGLKLKKQGKKVIYDSHEFYSYQIREKNWIPAVLRNAIAAWFYRYETRICKQLDAVICVCTIEGKNYFENRAKRVEFITNAPRLSEFAQMPQPAPEKQRAVCHIGGLTHNRGITHLVQAMQHTNNATLYLAGKFQSEEYETELKKQPSWSKVKYLGFLDRTQVVDVLSRSVAGIATLLNVGQYNRFDAFPIKVYEYMAAGIPVIFSKSDYAKKALQEDKFGICVQPDQPKEIARAIDYLLSHPDKAREMGENGRRAVLQKYNWSIEEKKLLALYASLQ